jgi:hypothetical protein
VGVVAESAELRTAIEQFREYIQRETLAVEIRFSSIPSVEPVEVDVAGHSLMLYLQPIPAGSKQ